MSNVPHFRAKTRRGEVKRDGRPLPTTTEYVKFTEQQWINRFEKFLEAQHCSMFGRGFDIHSESGRRVCAEWLAGCTVEAQKV